MRVTVFLVLVVLVAVAPDAVVGACQAAVSAAVGVIESLLSDGDPAQTAGVLTGGVL